MVNTEAENRGYETEEDEEQEPTFEDQEGDSEEKYYGYRIDRLTKKLHPFGLQPAKVFIHAVATEASTIKRGEFHSRFREFLKGLTPNFPEPTSKVIDDLFEEAIESQKMCVAWESTVMAIKSETFLWSLKFVRAKVRQFARARKARCFSSVGKQSATIPEWMSSWKHLWIEALDEIEEEILAQLRGAQRDLEKLMQFGRLGRTDMVSLILLLKKDSIKAIIAKTHLSRAPVVALAAFAHAAKLMPLRDDANDAKGRHINRVKARLSRAAASKSKLDVLGFCLQSYLNGPRNGIT